MSKSAGSLKSVVLWSLPSYAAVMVLMALAFVASSIPLGAQRTVEGVWMFVALFLPFQRYLRWSRLCIFRFVLVMRPKFASGNP